MTAAAASPLQWNTQYDTSQSTALVAQYEGLAQFLHPNIISIPELVALIAEYLFEGSEEVDAEAATIFETAGWSVKNTGEIRFLSLFRKMITTLPMRIYIAEHAVIFRGELGLLRAQFPILRSFAMEYRCGESVTPPPLRDEFAANGFTVTRLTVPTESYSGALTCFNTRDVTHLELDEAGLNHAEVNSIYESIFDTVPRLTRLSLVQSFLCLEDKTTQIIMARCPQLRDLQINKSRLSLSNTALHSLITSGIQELTVNLSSVTSSLRHNFKEPSSLKKLHLIRQEGDENHAIFELKKVLQGIHSIKSLEGIEIDISGLPFRKEDLVILYQSMNVVKFKKITLGGIALTRADTRVFNGIAKQIVNLGESKGITVEIVPCMGLLDNRFESW